ncbi:MAG: transglycosylase SLT domain-containing protein [Bdellovibrionota bacterium]
MAFEAKNYLNEYFKSESDGKHEDSKVILEKWKPKSFEEESYKKYFLALKNKNIEMFWNLYQELSKNKKLVKLQHESIRNILELDLASQENKVKNLSKFDKVSKHMLKRMSGLPDGSKYELLYLKWLLKNKNTGQLCKVERSRWLSQTRLYLIEVVQGLDSCPITLDDFVYRIRLLIFSGEAKKAQSEITDFSDIKKISDWEKAYLQAVYFSNVGDPTSAYDVLVKFEPELKNQFKNQTTNSEEYYANFFYISQRAGELVQAERIINNILKLTTHAAKKKDYIFQKAFLFYQTKRYAEANKLFSELIQSHPSRRNKTKSKDYDNLTWLQGWCYYLAKDYKKARESFIKNKKWTGDKPRNLYWLAQTEWALDNRMESLALYRHLALPVIEGQYFSYYNYLAWLRFEFNKNYIDAETLKTLKTHLNNLKSRSNQYELPDFTTDPYSIIEQYEIYFNDIDQSVIAAEEASDSVVTQNAAELSDNDASGIQITTSAELKNEMSWADDLIKWGYRDLAKWHLYEVEKSLPKKSHIEPLIEYYSKNKYYNRALFLVNSMSSPAGKKLKKSSDPLYWGSLYPKAYQSAVENEAQKRKINPYLLWSIMKAETQFKDDALSPVGAVGLMQFMPYTSQKVAKLLNENYNGTELLKPENAIKYGAMYLKKLSDELGGQLPLVAAAYNGGPHRVKLWLKNFKERDNSNMDYDVFIEHIPFNETRTYVKRVLSYNLTYQKLYDNKLDAKLTNWITEKISFKLQEPIALKEEWPQAVN